MEREHFGHSLRQARLKAGRSLDDIARVTKISSANLEHLEAGDRASLPAEVFVCGYLRAYARELGLDADECVARYRTVEVVHPCDSEPELVAPVAIVSADPDEAPGFGLRLGARLQAMIDGQGGNGTEGRVPSYALVVLLVVLVATITLSLLLGGDPRPGRGLS
ncbi:MAG: helix-turn-helix transcriptional regulator [Polyangia bacterium]